MNTLKLLFWPLLLFVVAALVLVLVPSPNMDDTDDKLTGARSNLRILIDHGTKCQYLKTSNGGLTPRLDAAGQPLCGAAK
jgi:hypothetical protein